ncbi:MAG TPA: hypothetical protein VMS60_01875 [Solirubrobacterales bacterium]|nr:hypothetical protein [Solirubrobacterales bacterium]
MSERLSRGEQIAGIAGLVLILVMFLFAWYGFEGFRGGDAFDVFDDWVNILLVFTCFAAMSLAIFGSDVARAAIPLSVVTTVLGGLSSLIVLIYILFPPSVNFGGLGGEVDLGRKFGVWLGLISAIAIAVGGYMAMQEEGASFGGTADRLGGPGNGTPTQPPQAPPPPPPPPPAH